MNKIDSIKYTLKHKKAFLKTEKEVLGKNSIRGYLHDIDKVFLYIIMGKKRAHKIHRHYAKHHMDNAKTKEDKIQMLIDWECARYTKPDKPLSAYEFLLTAYPDHKDELIPIIKEIGLDKNITGINK